MKSSVTSRNSNAAMRMPSRTAWRFVLPTAALVLEAGHLFDHEPEPSGANVDQRLDLEPVAVETEEVTMPSPDRIESVREVGEPGPVHPVDDRAQRRRCRAVGCR